MLYEFLEQHRAEVLALTEERTLKLAGPLLSSPELKRGLPLFYDHLISYLKNPILGSAEGSIVSDASVHGKELLRLNYTLSHVVHSYGAMCQAVTELAQRRDATVTTQEFNDLNLCLDIAIAAAVSEYQFRSVKASEEREVQHLGFLVHELRNALSSAAIAHEMIKQGLVGTGGSTGRVLEENLIRMRHLIDRSLSDVRMRADPEVHIEKFNLGVLVDQILLTAQSEARGKTQKLKNDIGSDVELETDRQLLLSAIANLTQNAMKYSKNGGSIWVRGGISGDTVVVEIEDECGGVKAEAEKNLFKPFNSSGFDQSGLGLGLTIVQRAIFLLGGTISFRNHPGQGCAFMLVVPRKLTPVKTPKAPSGPSSAHPPFRT